MSENTPATPPAEEPSDAASKDDLQAKMKAALDRKHAAETAGQAHLDAHSKSQQTHGKSGGGRQFRRKSGG